MWANTRRTSGMVALGVLAACAGAQPARGQGCNTPTAAGHMRAAGTHMASGQYRDAISEFNRAILAAPDCDEAKQGIIEANRALLRRRAAADSPEATLNRHINLGGAAFEAGDYARAIAEWEAALALDPNNRVAMSLIASAREAQVDELIEEGSRLFAAGDTEGAVAAWEHAQELDPFNTAVADLLSEGREQSARDKSAQSQEDLEATMRRIRQEITRTRVLPYDDMSGGGIRLRDVAKRPELASAQFGAEARSTIMAELRNPVSLDFEETDLRAVLRFLSEVTGINILIDEAVFEELGEDDPDDPDADPQIKITIFVNELPLESALKGMLRQHGLDFQIQRDFLYISTPDVLRASSFEQLEVRYYRLRDTARISLPKMASAGADDLSETGGDTEVSSAIGDELVRRLSKVLDTSVLDGPSAPLVFSTARLLSLLRNFVPTVVESTTAGGQKGGTRQQVSRSTDTVVGGWNRLSDTATIFMAEGVTRERAWDSAGREVLSRMEYDAATHTIIAKNTPSNLDLMEEMLDRLDRPTKQVLIESRFMQVDMADIQRVNTDLSLLNIFRDTASGRSIAAGLAGASGGTGAIPGLVGSAGPAVVKAVDAFSGSGIAGTGGLFVDTLFGSPSRGKQLGLGYVGKEGELVSATIDLLTQLDNTELVSAPRITTLSGKPAVIQDIRTQTFLTDVDFTVTTISPPAGSSISPTSFVEPDFSFTAVVTGVTMTVTPLVLDDNTIRLVLLPDVSNLGEGDTFDAPFPIFGEEEIGFGTVSINLIEIFRQSLYTNVTVGDGETLVLGGLVDTESRFQERSIPFFRSLPFVGNFFRSTGESIRRSQLLIFIKCNIISPESIAYTRLK